MKILRRPLLVILFIVLSIVVVLITGCGQTINITNASVNDSGHLILSLSNGQSLDAGYVVGPAGATGATGSAGPTGATGPAGQSTSITNASVNGSGHLILTLSNGQSLDAGYVVGPEGATGPAGPAGSGGSQNLSLSSIVAQISPTLVYIDVEGPRFAASATGIIISTEGYILTCYHVVSGATTIEVTLSDGQTIPATVVAESKGRDDAVIKLNTVPPNLQAAVLGSSSSVAIGDSVLAAGFALGYSYPTFTSGIVSAFPTLSDGYKYIQTDAAINAGDSGGPLVNMSGQVIGVNDAGETYDNENDPVMNMEYCIPIDEVQALIISAIGS